MVPLKSLAFSTERPPPKPRPPMGPRWRCLGMTVLEFSSAISGYPLP